MGEPGFWDDPEAAGRVGSEHARLGRRLDTFEKLQADAEDLDGLVELAEEDEEIAGELEETLVSVETRLAAPEAR
jgi:peptide chain release factor 2